MWPSDGWRLDIKRVNLVTTSFLHETRGVSRRLDKVARTRVFYQFQNSTD